MIFIGLGSNSPGPWGDPQSTVTKAFQVLLQQNVKIIAMSSKYTSRSYGRAETSDYVNAVACIEAWCPPEALLVRMQAVERLAARRRTRRWGARTLDIDLLDWHGRICGPRAESGPIGGAVFRPLSLPHPGIRYRPFVAIPLAEIAPRWHHPVTGETAVTLARKLSAQGQGGILARLPQGGEGRKA